MKVTVKYKLSEKTFSEGALYADGTVFLKNLPGNLTNYSIELTYDLDAPWFELVEGTDGFPAQIKISAKDEAQLPSSIKVLWRFQISEGFDDLDYLTQFGRWPSTGKSSKFKKIISFLKNNTPKTSIRHLYVTFADTKTGNCVQRYVQVDIDQTKRMCRWSYIKKNNYYLRREL